MAPGGPSSPLGPGSPLCPEENVPFVCGVTILRLVCSRTSDSVVWREVKIKIPKIRPGAYIFQRLFLRGLFLEGLIFGRAYLRGEICVSKSIGLAL